MTHDEMIAVLKAHRDGKVVQLRRRYGDESAWGDYVGDKDRGSGELVEIVE